MNYASQDAAALLTLARQDAGLTQKDLAARSGVHQPVISAIENGRRRASPELLSRLLRAAQLRPSVPLEFYADQLRATAVRYGIETVRVFGSAIQGHDNAESDVDLLVTLAPTASMFDLAAFRQEAEQILGFPVDVIPDDSEGLVADRARSEAVLL